MAPGAKGFARMRIGKVRLHTLIVRASETAAQMVPRQAPLEGVSPAARRRLPIDHAALVVLRERSPGFLEDRRRGKAPALDAAGAVEVGQEVGLERGPVGEGARQIGDVVL